MYKRFVFSGLVFYSELAHFIKFLLIYNLYIDKTNDVLYYRFCKILFTGVNTQYFISFLRRFVNE